MYSTEGNSADTSAKSRGLATACKSGGRFCTMFSVANPLPTLILDEPEVFLHPDLQRRLVRLLEFTDKQVVVATHSSELLAEVDPRDIALVDRSVRSARKMKEDSALLSVADQLGSRFNLALSKALRSRAVLFVEGRDAKLLRLVARAGDFPLIEREHGLAIVEMDGFSPHDHVEAFDWLCKTTSRTLYARTFFWTATTSPIRN